MGPVLFFLSMLVVTGLLYPLAVTGVVRVIFPEKSAGSLIVKDGKVIGSELIAQPFTNPKYFWPRPSASNYHAVPSAASNLAPTNPQFPKQGEPTSSGSGLDPHITLEMALDQIDRIASARGVDRKTVESVLTGKHHMNVLLANLELDIIAP
ncbi:MAG: potassium-transporting ATPase subunit C [Myxococcota bacterium]